MQMPVDCHENEIPGAPKLLKCLGLREKVVIGEALHTQGAVSLQSVVSGGDYIWFAKGNQPGMEEDIRLWFGPDPEPIPGMSYPPKDFETATTTNEGHGRMLLPPDIFHIIPNFGGDCNASARWVGAI